MVVQMKVICEDIVTKHTTTSYKIDKYCCRKMKKVMNPPEEYYSILRVTKCGIELPYAYKYNCGGYCEIDKKLVISYCPFCGREIGLDE